MINQSKASPKPQSKPQVSTILVYRIALHILSTQKTKLTNEVSTSPKQPEHGKSSAFHESRLEVTNETSIKRQIVQVIISLIAVSNVTSKCGGPKQSPLSHPHIRSPLATTETENTTFIRQVFATTERVPVLDENDYPIKESTLE